MRKHFTLLVATTLFALLAVAPARADALRVCEDPNYLPFSNRAGQGFENEIAAFVARSLGSRLVYTWETERGPGGFDQFVHDTLDAKRCDVLVDVPYASEDVLTTRPYYVSSYVFVFEKSKHYDITSMDSPALKGLRIGFESDTPAENGLKIRALVLHGVPFDTSDDPGGSPQEMLDALESGRISVAITWEPAIGTYLLQRPKLAVVAVPNSRSQGAPEQYAFPMAMGVRLHDSATRDRLNAVIAAHSVELTRILARAGVRLYKPSDVATR